MPFLYQAGQFMALIQVFDLHTSKTIPNSLELKLGRATLFPPAVACCFPPPPISGEGPGCWVGKPSEPGACGGVRAFDPQAHLDQIAE